MIEFETVENTSKIYYNGSVWETKNHGKLTVIGKSNKNAYFICKFADETIVESNKSHIRIGMIKNPNAPSAYGIGYMGQGNYNKGNSPKQYSTWRDMLRRCYSENFQLKYPTYKNCAVDERWHNFQNFCEDIVKIEGYEKWIESKYIMTLDKDVKQQNIINKIYSLETCIFITNIENVKEAQSRSVSGSIKAHLTGKIFKAKRKSDNYEEIFINISNFAKKYGLHSSGISGCIKGTYKQSSGWIFETIS